MTEERTDGTAPRFRGKVALIVGASRGIGAVTAKAFAREGATVVLASRDQPALEGVAREIRATGGTSLV
ncbi:MAG: SDR family NAD(P)-dependent oxidoreductase, partial [Acidimicrobiales bacterium]